MVGLNTIANWLHNLHVLHDKIPLTRLNLLKEIFEMKFKTEACGLKVSYKDSHLNTNYIINEKQVYYNYIILPFGGQPP